jgi:hypothetical protein
MHAPAHTHRDIMNAVERVMCRAGANIITTLRVVVSAGAD